MGKKEEENKVSNWDVKTVLVLVGLIVLVVLWFYGMSYIIASLIGLFIGKTVSVISGFYALVFISLLSVLFTGK